MTFFINGWYWKVIFVNKNSDYLIDRTGAKTLATTDPISHTIYISNSISGEKLIRVIKHELAHCIIVSYNLTEDIHRMVKREYWIEAEEWICNFISVYDEDILILTTKILKNGL